MFASFHIETDSWLAIRALDKNFLQRVLVGGAGTMPSLHVSERCERNVFVVALVFVVRVHCRLLRYERDARPEKTARNGLKKNSF